MEADDGSCNITSLNLSNVNPEFCELDNFKAFYSPIHGFLALIVCFIGLIFNSLNLMVLTSKDMRSNPVNMLLTGIAGADFLLMLEYVPFTFHIYWDRPMEEKVTKFTRLKIILIDFLDFLPMIFLIFLVFFKETWQLVHAENIAKINHVILAQTY